jgi:hypothetical protein
LGAAEFIIQVSLAKSGQKQENPAAKAGFSLISAGCRNICCDSPFRQPVTSGSTYFTDWLHR